MIFGLLRDLGQPRLPAKRLAISGAGDIHSVRPLIRP
jgi:hypothetical protein